jgi:hypothetical protein
LKPFGLEFQVLEYIPYSLALPLHIPQALGASQVNTRVVSYLAFTDYDYDGKYMVYLRQLEEIRVKT